MGGGRGQGLSVVVVVVGGGEVKRRKVKDSESEREGNNKWAPSHGTELVAGKSVNSMCYTSWVASALGRSTLVKQKKKKK